MVRQAVTREDYREVRDNFEDLYFDFTDPTAFRWGPEGLEYSDPFPPRDDFPRREVSC